MNRIGPASRASCPLMVALLATLSACGGGGMKKGPPAAAPDSGDQPLERKDAQATQPDAPLDSAPDTAADAPVDRARDLAPDTSFDLPTGPQPLGASCEIPGGGMLPCESGLLCCKPCCDGRPAVCTRPVSNAAGIGVGKCPLPDLTVDKNALRTSVGLGPMSFSTSSCEAREACVDTPGMRNALHFEVTTPNIGSADLVLGSPLAGGTTIGEGFVYSRCHEHYHFAGYALYQLIGADGKEVLRGKKRAFCLEDYTPLDNFPLPHTDEPKYDCDNQGIQVGWADTYYNGLVCQFMDVTGVAPGSYTLRVTVNPEHVFPELTYDNNVAEVPVTIPAMTGGPTDPCVGMVPGLNRECGWKVGGSFSCTPGARVSAGCGTECGLGTASGDPEIRVCPGDTACAWPGLGGNDDCTTSENAHGSKVTVLCPSSGRITVLTGPAFTGDPAGCNVEVK
jgi:hypothetical protein